MQLTLNKKSREILEKRLDMSFEDISKMDVEELDKLIEKKIKKKLTYQRKYKSMIGRGSVYLYLNRLLSREKVDKRLSKI